MTTEEFAARLGVPVNRLLALRRAGCLGVGPGWHVGVKGGLLDWNPEFADRLCAVMATGFPLMVAAKAAAEQTTAQDAAELISKYAADGFSVREIADIVGLPKSNVHRAQLRATRGFP